MRLKYDRHNKYHRFARACLITALSLAALLWLWWLASVLIQKQLHFNSPPLATPHDSFAALFDLIQNGDPIEHRSLWSWLWASLQKFLKGFLLALCGGSENSPGIRTQSGVSSPPRWPTGSARQTVSAC